MGFNHAAGGTPARDAGSRYPCSMKLLIGTKEIDEPGAARFFNILEVSEQSLAPRELRAYQTDDTSRSGNMRNWGFAWHADHLYAPNRNQGLLQYDQDLNVTATYPCLPAADAGFKPAPSPYGMAQFDRPHQIACLGQRVFICDSGHNLLRVFDIASRTFQSIGFGTQRNWINSVNLIGDEIHVVFHNHGWSDLLVLDHNLIIRREIRRIGVCAHHIWSMRGERWICSSLEGKLRSIDSDRSIDLGGYPRGVAMSGRWLIVGISKTRTSNSLERGLPPRAATQRPVVGNSGLAFLDMETLAITRTIEFHELSGDPNYRMPFVFEVRMLDVLDPALHSEQPLRLGNIDRFQILQRTLPS
jgi:hypothetical protein